MRIGELAQLVFPEAGRRMRHELPARELRFLDGCRGALLAARAFDLQLADVARQPFVFRL